MKVLSPSILSADMTILGEQITLAEKGGATALHLDIMDGHFVPNLSYGVHVCECVRKKTKMFLDSHLMVTNPEDFIEPFAKAGADLISFHWETQTPDESIILLQRIRKLGKKSGIAISPDTPTDVLAEVLEFCDLALVMSVYPGYGGQKFIPESIEKIKTVKMWVENLNLSCDIQVDGGITLDNVLRVVEAGATNIVAGSSVFGAVDIEGRCREFIKIIGK